LYGLNKTPAQENDDYYDRFMKNPNRSKPAQKMGHKRVLQSTNPEEIYEKYLNWNPKTLDNFYIENGFKKSK